MSHELKMCKACEIEGMFDPEEIKCHECGTELTPLSLIPTSELAALRAENAKLKRAIVWALGYTNFEKVHESPPRNGGDWWRKPLGVLSGVEHEEAENMAKDMK